MLFSLNYLLLKSLGVGSRDHRKSQWALRWLTRKAIRQRENRGKCLLERCAFPENLIALLSIGKSRLMLAGKINLSRKSGCTAEGWKSRVMPAAKVNLRRKSGCTSTSMATRALHQYYITLPIQA
jgi:hypothetical protein